MGYTILVFVIVGAVLLSRVGKITGSAKGQRVCMFCGKRLKYLPTTGAYATVCPRCGKTQTNR